MNPYLLEFELNERRRIMIAEADRRRLVNLYNARYPRKTDKLFLALADFLIDFGEALRRRHAKPQVVAGDFCRE
ncbi:MAG: hypothetical protein KJ630_10870 [Proteobacteria bacterium]|nr:hypothetical protein [Pseudomonadota bacterium]